MASYVKSLLGVLMFKSVISGLLGLLAGFGLCVYSAPGYWFDHLGDNVEVIEVGKEYEFNTFGSFIANTTGPETKNFVSFPEPEEDFRFVKHDLIYSISASDVELVCFGTGYEGAPNFQISVFLRPEAQERFMAGILSAEGHKVSMAFKGNLIDTFVFNPGAADGYKVAGKQTYPPDVMNPLNRVQDINLSVRHRDNHLSLLRLAHYLSPDHVPKGCNEWFKPALVEDWDELVEWIW